MDNVICIDDEDVWSYQAFPTHEITNSFSFTLISLQFWQFWIFQWKTVIQRQNSWLIVLNQWIILLDWSCCWVCTVCLQPLSELTQKGPISIIYSLMLPMFLRSFTTPHFNYSNVVTFIQQNMIYTYKYNIVEQHWVYQEADNKRARNKKDIKNWLMS